MNGSFHISEVLTALAEGKIIKKRKGNEYRLNRGILEVRMSINEGWQHSCWQFPTFFFQIDDIYNDDMEDRE